MFCSSLRSRKELSTLIPILTAHSTPKFRETNLKTHDITLPLPTSKSLLILILTPKDLVPERMPETMKRIERFLSITGGASIAIGYLLTTSPIEKGATISESYAFIQLQLDIQTNHPLTIPPPLLPIPSINALLPTLLTYTQTSSQPSQQSQTTIPSTLSLLKHTTTTSPAIPLDQHSTNILTDICHSIVEVAEMSAMEEGRNVLGEWMGEDVAVGVCQFWEGEWGVD